jgi:DNA polymerase
MNVDERRELWQSLSVVEDWLGGFRKPRASPDFEALAVQSEADSLAAIALAVRACKACRLGEKRSLAVSGQGPDAPLALVVGETPGADEDTAGQLLDKMLLSIGLSRETNCFIASVVKCRPPQNRDPSGDEQEACMPYLRRQIALLRPKAILCIGRVAADAILGSSEGVDRLRGYWREFDGIPVLVSYHPSTVLRDESLKRPAWEDLKAFRAKLSSLS